MNTKTHQTTVDRATFAPRGILAGDNIVIDGRTFQVREADYGYSPAGIPNVSLVLWHDFATDYTRHTFYTA